MPPAVTSMGMGTKIRGIECFMFGGLGLGFGVPYLMLGERAGLEGPVP